MLRKRAGEDGRDGARPAPKQRQAFWVPSLASLYGQVALRQENAYLSVGERCNANGSTRFRVLQESGDWDGCVAMGVEQTREGSHAIDVCTAFVGRHAIAELTEMVRRMHGSRSAPLVFDSTRLPVVDETLKLNGRKQNT